MTITLSRLWWETDVLYNILSHPHLQDVDSALADDLTYVMRDEKRHVVAYAVMRPGKRCDRLKSLFTMPAYRGRGHASTLLKVVLSDSRKPVLLTCKEYMLDFYRKRGFLVTSRPPFFVRLRLLFCNRFLSVIYPNRWHAMTFVPKRRMSGDVTSRPTWRQRASRLRTIRR